MKPQSAKSKGRKLQQLVRDSIFLSFPELREGDVRSTSMGAPGADILLSPKALECFPYSVECKNKERHNVFADFKQAKANTLLRASPLLVLKKNNEEPLAILRLTDFMKVIVDAKGKGSSHRN